MALKGASKVVSQDQDWIDWEDLAKERAAVVCTVLEIEEEEDFGNGVVAPVRADVIVLTGKHAGEVHANERILKAGIRNKLTEVGDSVVGRIGVYGKRKAIGLEAELDGDVELAEVALAKFTANGNGSSKTKAKATNTAVGDDQDPPF